MSIASSSTIIRIALLIQEINQPLPSTTILMLSILSFYTQLCSFPGALKFPAFCCISLPRCPSTITSNSTCLKLNTTPNILISLNGTNILLVTQTKNLVSSLMTRHANSYINKLWCSVNRCHIPLFFSMTTVDTSIWVATSYLDKKHRGWSWVTRTWSTHLFPMTHIF